ncbi:hypothetical protein OHW75_01580 [Acinetobacter baumannii]|nr:hypothetical protein [Acinetobacter baumannii]
MNGYLKIGGILPAGPAYKKLSDITLLPCFIKEGLAAGYSLKDHGAFNFVTGSYSEVIGTPLKMGNVGALLSKDSFIDTGVSKSESFTYVVIAKKTVSQGFLIGDYIHSTIDPNGKNRGTTINSRGDVYAAVPTGTATAFTQQASNINDELTLFIYTVTQASPTSYQQVYANLQKGVDVFLSKSATDLVNDTDNTVGVGWSKKADVLGWSVLTEVAFACVYNKGFTQPEIENWAHEIRQDLANYKNLVI